MARRDLNIPQEVKDDIRSHLRERTHDAMTYGYFSGAEEEDTLTGDLGATIRTRNRKVTVKDDIEKTQQNEGGKWIWSINYTKFRGRGPRATENILGADGIFELTIQRGNTIENKSILFQTKKDWTYDQNIIPQALKLSNWREAAFVLNFTESAYEVFDLDTVISSAGYKPDSNKLRDVGSYLGGDFLDCVVGDVHLKYDAKKRNLSWLTVNGEYVTTRFSIPQKIRLQISAPNHNGRNRTISNDEVFEHRMEFAPEEILSLENRFDEKELRKARAEKARIFHLDVNNFNDGLLNQLMNKRMQDINSSYDKLKTKLRKK